ncbi:unnamed protein product, partial [Ilex paraguariensis]
SQALSPIKSPTNSIFGPRLHSSHNSFPIIAVAIIGILATAFLLVSYYIFVIKCCLNWHRIDLLRRFSFSRRRLVENSLMVYSPAIENRGLDEAVIRSIPIIQFQKGSKENLGERSFCDCSVCLNEFQEGEKLRIIPNCRHVFHIDCIDIWLQTNANCPLCRRSISSTTRFQLDQTIGPIASSPEDQTRYTDNFTGRDEDYVVIELGDHNSNDQTLLRVQERLDSGELLSLPSISPPPRKLEPRVVQKKMKKLSHECIDMREKDDQFAVQPIRRSFSMDSASDKQLYLAVQEIIMEQNSVVNEVSSSEGSSSRVRRSFFSFGYGRGSRSAVLPIHLEP